MKRPADNIALVVGQVEYPSPYETVLGVTLWRDETLVVTDNFEQVAYAPKPLQLVELSKDQYPVIKGGTYAFLDGMLFLPPAPDNTFFVIVRGH